MACVSPWKEPCEPTPVLFQLGRPLEVENGKGDRLLLSGTHSEGEAFEGVRRVSLIV